jgi:cytidylate kinase
VLRVIAIDGPAASGKSSTGSLVARELGWTHLDSGALYRAVTLAVLDRFEDTPNRVTPTSQILRLLDELRVGLVLVGDEFRPEIAGVDVERAIRDDRVTRHVSTIAALPEIRAWVNDQQRAIARDQPRGVVVDGRDIGTVVFPDAPLKVYLTATPDERAKRRLSQRGQAADAAEVRRESAALAARDAADSSRAVAPLKPAADAVLLDSTTLTLRQQVAQVVELARRVFPG